MEPSFDSVLISIIIGMWITSMVRLALVSNSEIKNFAADLISIAAGCSAGFLVYQGL